MDDVDDWFDELLLKQGCSDLYFGFKMGKFILRLLFVLIFFFKLNKIKCGGNMLRATDNLHLILSKIIVNRRRVDLCYLGRQSSVEWGQTATKL